MGLKGSVEATTLQHESFSKHVRTQVAEPLESFFKEVKESLAKGENVYVRGFGSFIIKRRKQKIGRIISTNTPIVVPEHNLPAFKPADTFIDKVKDAPYKK